MREPSSPVNILTILQAILLFITSTLVSRFSLLLTITNKRLPAYVEAKKDTGHAL